MPEAFSMKVLSTANPIELACGVLIQGAHPDCSAFPQNQHTSCIIDAFR